MYKFKDTRLTEKSIFLQNEKKTGTYMPRLLLQLNALLILQLQK